MRSFRKAHRPNVSHLPPGARFLLKAEWEGGATPHPRRSGGRDPKGGGGGRHMIYPALDQSEASALAAPPPGTLCFKNTGKGGGGRKKSSVFFWGGGVIFDKSMRCRFLFAKSHVLFHIRSKRCETVTETTQHNTTLPKHKPLD